MNKIQHLLLREGVPVGVILVFLYELDKCGAKGVVQRAVNEAIRLDNGRRSIQRRNQARLPEEFCLGAQLFNALMAL